MLSSPSFGSHHECSDSIPPVRDRPMMQEGFLPPSHLIRFRFALEFPTLRLSYMLDSLVRVTRRVVQYLFTSVDKTMVHAPYNQRCRPPLLTQIRTPSPAAQYISPRILRHTRSCLQSKRMLEHEPIRPQRANPPKHLAHTLLHPLKLTLIRHQKV